MNYIIGAGITAAAVHYFFPNSMVIAPSYGRVPKTFFVWKDKNTMKFVREFRIAYEEKKIIVGKKGNNIKLYNKITDKKKKNFPCENKESFEGLMLNNLKIPLLVKDTIFEVKKDHLVGGKRCYYDVKNVFWTAHIDKTTFFGEKFMVSYKPITFLNFKTSESLFKENILYLLEEKFLNKGIYRATRNNGEWSFEVNKLLCKKEERKIVEFLCDEFGISVNCYSGKAELPKARVVTEEKTKDYENLFFIGRYAQCDYEIKLNDVIEKLYKIKETMK